MLPFMAALLLSTALTPPAFANGGTGGVNGAGGVDSATGAGSAGTTDPNGYGGGSGGGAGTSGGAGSAGQNGGAGGAGAADASVNGGNGGDTGGNGAGGGGGGAHGYVGSTAPTAASTGSNGGNGGTGSDNPYSYGGGGGAGGWGAVITGSSALGTLSVNVQGGNGGAGGGGGWSGGAGGTGGTGLYFDSSATKTITIDAAVAGGTGGARGDSRLSVNYHGAQGAGGVGIIGSNLEITVTSSASISGGLDGSGTVRANAITFTGGNNTLQLDAGATIVGNVDASGTGDDSINVLRVNQATNGVFDLSSMNADGQFRGFATFEKMGTGTTTVTGSSSQVTTWNVLNGTLAVGTGEDEEEGDLNADVVVSTGAALRIVDTQSATYAGAVSGGGQVVSAHEGLIITGDWIHTGGTVIESGSLQIGNGETAGSIAGDIENNAALSFNRSDIVTFSGGILGTGALTQAGSGTLILTGANTHTGGTTIDAGTLQIGSGGTLGSLTGDIENNAALSFNRSDTVTYNGVISETGTVTQAGSGTLILTGTNTYTGATTISDGTLVVGVSGAGSIASQVTISGEGTLKGTGTVGGVIGQSGGVHAPGNSIGTQTVNGAYALGAGSILEIEANAAGESDSVVVIGTVDITGATLRVLAENGTYDDTTDYLIIDNDGVDAVTGTFSTITSNFAFLDPTVSYTGGTGNDVVLTLTRNQVDFTDIAVTPNQNAVAGALSEMDIDASLVDAILGLSTEGAQAAFNALTGELHASVSSTLARDSHFTRNAIFARLQQAYHSRGGAQNTATLGNTGTTAVAGNFDTPPMALGMGSGKGASFGDAPRSASPLTFWTQGFGSWGDSDGSANAASVSRNIGGFLSGVDAIMGSGWQAGLALGYSHSNVSVSDRASSAKIGSAHLAAYAGGPVDVFAFRTGASWSWNDIESERAVVFSGFNDRVEANYDGGTGQLFGEIALPLTAGNLAYEVFAGLAYVHVETDRFAEKGGDAALEGFGGDQDTGFSTVGVRFAWATTMGGMRVTPRASFAWQHAFGDIDPTRALAFADAPDMSISGTPIAKNSALIEVGLDLALSPDATLAISYNGEVARDAGDHGISGRLTWRF